MFNFLKEFQKNQLIDHIQKVAWRLVRSAEDNFVSGEGKDKREWCVLRMAIIFPKEKTEHLEDAIRAAYVNFKIETGDYQRRMPRL